MSVNMEQRRKNSRIMNIYMSIVICIIVVIICALDGKFFIGTLLGVGLGLGSYFFMDADTERNMAYNKDQSAGSGGFMTEKDLKNYNDKFISPEPPKDEKHKYDPSPNMIMSYNFRRPVNSRKLIGNNNVLVEGAAGTGKSRFVIKPNILQLNCSYVITDPSGEMISATGTMLKEAGYEIKIFNISDMQHSN